MATIVYARISYDEAAAAEACSVGVDEIRRWVKDGRLTPTWAGARASKPLYRPEDLDAAVLSLPTERGGR